MHHSFFVKVIKLRRRFFAFRLERFFRNCEEHGFGIGFTVSLSVEKEPGQTSTIQ